MEKKSFIASWQASLRGFFLLMGLVLAISTLCPSPVYAAADGDAATDDEITSLAEDLKEEFNSALLKRLGLTVKKFMDILEEQDDTKGLRNVEEAYCIRDITSTYGDLQSLLAGLARSFAALIINQILSLIEDILNAVCEYITTAIENVLNMVCLPLPTLSLGDLSLPSLDAVSCDGVSLADFVTVERASPVRFKRYGIPNSYMNVPMMRARPGGTSSPMSFGAD